jgi:hypothetical protein
VVDLDPPVGMCVIPSVTVFNRTIVSLSATAFDALSATSWYVQVDGGPWLSPPGSTGTAVVVTLAEGPHNVSCGAVDSAGNVQHTGFDTWTLTIDTQAPIVSVSSRPEPYIQNLTSYLCLSIRDASAFEIHVVLDGAHTTLTAMPASGCLTLYAPYDGNHSATVVVVDAAGNAAASVSNSWITDTVSPSHTAIPLLSGCGVRGATTVCNSTSGMRMSLSCNASSETAVSESPCRVQWQLQLIGSSASQGCGSSSSSSGTGSASSSSARLLTDASGSVTTLQSWVSLPASASPSVTVVLPSPLLFDGQVCFD